jgi:pimeloyl-ACP methyl ester carboxylesterase
MQRRLRRLLGCVAAMLATSAVVSAAARAAYPVNWDFSTAVQNGVWYPGTPPPGADNWSCRPSASHPYPVVLVHGTLENQNDNWQALAPVLANDGFCVYTFTYGETWYSGGIDGIADIYASAQQLGSFIEQVRSSTGAGQVDLVGHSQGGMLPRVYMKYDGGAPYVHRLVGLAPDNALPGLSGWTQFVNQFPDAQQVIDEGCPACSEQTTPSFFSALNADGETVSSVLYTVIATTHDEIVTPAPTQSYLPPSVNVTNESVQDVCPNDPVGHAGLPYDRDAVQIVVNALDPANAQPVTCSSGFGL